MSAQTLKKTIALAVGVGLLALITLALGGKLPFVPDSLRLALSGVMRGQTAAVTNFSYTGGIQTYTVPAGVHTIFIKAWGAGGGAYQYAGGGGYVQATVSVTAGQVLTVVSGGGGAGGNAFGGGGAGMYFSLSGGGGFSGVFNGSCTVGGTCTQANAIVIAGGGGGAGCWNGCSGGTGGAGGGTTGGVGSTPSGQSGGGGTQVSGGAGGLSYIGGAAVQGGAGSALRGGDGGVPQVNNCGSAGGGGGGYWGGGGGAAGGNYCGGGGVPSSGGGGGGSSYCGGAGVMVCTTTAGSGATPGNSADPLKPSGVGVGGASGGTAAGGAGHVTISTVPLSITANPQNVASGGRSYISWTSSGVVANSCTVTGPFGDITGFYSLGADSSGNNNHFIPINSITGDQVIDTPTNTFATINGLDVGVTSGSGNSSYNGNTAAVAGTSGSRHFTPTFGATTGKWYTEAIVGATGSSGAHTDFVSITIPGNPAAAYAAYDKSGDHYTASSGWVAGWATFTTGDSIGVALDTDAGSVSFYKNGVLQGTLTNIGSVGALIGMGVYPYSGASWTINYGQGGFSGVTYFADAGGRFKYEPPTGYKALSTANLSAPGIVKPSNYFDAKTYSGNVPAPTVQTFGYTGAVQTWTVPAGTTVINFKMWGAGGSSWIYAGAGGGYTGGTLAVTPGQVLTFVVGGGGVGTTGGFGGGGNSAYAYSAGGGYSGIFLGSCAVGSTCNASNAKAVAGGGGGGGQYNNGAGGGPGGAGGGASGAGGSGQFAGGGGTQTAGGSGSVYPGTAFQGGAGTGAAPYGTGGGGGGGWYGGGGAHFYGGGGGGSGYCGGSGVSNCTTVAGSGGTPGNYTDADYPGGVGYGGASSGSSGQNGYLRISYWTSVASQTVPLNFQPDLVWVKSRDTQTSGGWNTLVDAVRGVAKTIFSNSTSVETTNDTNGYVSAFSPTGFTVTGTSNANQNSVNYTGKRYVAWAWDESTTTGLDIVSYTGTGAAHTVAHSLGAVPQFILVKNRSRNASWAVYHGSVGPTKVLQFDTSAAATDPTSWNNTAPTTGDFTVGTANSVNANGENLVAYLFRSMPGFSKFGTYTGNGSADGTFIYTGFKPRWILIRPLSIGWLIIDTARNQYNPNNNYLWADVSNAEGGLGNYWDFVSNGIKVRTADTNWNNTGTAYIYAAFAEQPFETFSGSTSGYTIANSMRFRAAGNAYFTRSFTSSATWTFSAWVKRGYLATISPILGSAIKFNADDTLTAGSLTTSAVFRDPAAWLHIVVSNGGLYVNNVYYGAVTTSALSSPRIGSDGSNYFDGYLADVYFVDGTSLTPSSFGVADSNGYWRPKAYTGTYGAKGFHLEFTNPTGGSMDNSPTPYQTPPVTSPQTYTLQCTLADGTNSQVSVSTTVGVLENSPVLSITASDSNGADQTGSVTIPAGITSTIKWSTQNVQANSCHVARYNSLTNATTTDYFAAQDDNTAGEAENFTTSTSGYRRYTLTCNDTLGGSAIPATVTVNLGPSILVTVSKIADAAEGAAPTSGTFRISRTGSTDAALTVNFTTGGTAAPGGVDFQNFGTSAVIPAGASSVNISVSPRTNDSVFQGAKTLILTLASGGYTPSSPSSATMNIVDDDAGVPPTVSSFSATRARRGSAATLSWNLSGMTAGMSCTISPEPASQPSCSGVACNGAGSTQTQPLTVSTVFTLTCGVTGATANKSTTATLLPTVQEI